MRARRIRRRARSPAMLSEMSTTRLTAAIDSGGIAARRSRQLRPSGVDLGSTGPASRASRCRAPPARRRHARSAGCPAPVRGRRAGASVPCPPAPGRMPIATSGWPMTVRGEPIRRSSADRNSQPPPRAAPSSSPMVSSRPDESRSNVARRDVGFGLRRVLPGGHREDLLDVAVHQEEVRVGAAEEQHPHVTGRVRRAASSSMQRADERAVDQIGRRVVDRDRDETRAARADGGGENHQRGRPVRRRPPGPSFGSVIVLYSR